MPAKAVIDFALHAVAIGPLPNLQMRSQVSSLSFGIYANNGSGKTFISRLLRLADPIIESSTIEVTDSYLTRRESSGALKLEIQSSSDQPKRTRSLEIKLRRGNEPDVNNTSGYLFHVFNSDYVEENLSARRYSPNGDIEGYILGKGNVDVDEERRELRDVGEQRDSVREDLETVIRDVRAQLSELEVRSTTNEFRAITLAELVNPGQSETDDSFREVLAQYKRLLSLPDDLPDLVVPRGVSATDVLDEIESFLSRSFASSKLPADVAQKIRDKLAFVEAGVGHMHGLHETCPFCEQQLQQGALLLIEQYEQFLSDEEATARRNAAGLERQITDLVNAIEAFESAVLRLSSDFDNMKSYFPSFAEERIHACNLAKAVKEALASIKDVFARKLERIDETVFDVSADISGIRAAVAAIGRAIDVQTEQIVAINTAKNDSRAEKLALRRSLCTSRLQLARSDNSDMITQYKELCRRGDELTETIARKEATERQSKRATVASSLCEYLDYFFHGKYTLDESTFTIQFDGVALDQNASRVLSDGEKNVVAFCHFLAESHRIVDTSADYAGLYFVIDDPISSMDFHYVYAMAELLRNLKDYLAIGRNRTLLLTHNIEFMSILLRNKVLTKGYVLSNGKITDLKHELVMPYEGHLRDIYEVSRLTVPPSHHTPNSIRHILETIANFESPGTKLSTLFGREPDLKKNGFLHALIQDGSHGALRNQRPYHDAQVIEGCQVVIAFVKSRFPGQVSKITRN